jgi:hypothetical protein
MEEGDICQIFTDCKEESPDTFEGWAKILEQDGEPYETFLIGKDLYQLFRYKVEFIQYKDLNGRKEGKYNDRFMNKPFVTYRKLRVLIQANVEDHILVELSYSPVKKTKRNEQVIKQRKSCQVTNRGETSQTQLYHSGKATGYARRRCLRDRAERRGSAVGYIPHYFGSGVYFSSPVYRNKKS